MNHSKPSTEADLLLHALYALELNIKHVYFVLFFISYSEKISTL